MRELKEAGEKMCELLTRDFRSEKRRADDLTNSFLLLERCMVEVLDVAFGAEYKVLALKEAFEKIDNIYQDMRGGTQINFSKYREAYYDLSLIHI